MFEVGFSVTENCQSFLPLFYHLHEAGALHGPGSLAAPDQELLEGGSCASPLRLGSCTSPSDQLPAEGSYAPSPDWSPSAPSPPGPALLKLPAAAPACQLRPLWASGHRAISSPRPPPGASLFEVSSTSVISQTGAIHGHAQPPPAGAEANPPPWSQQHSPCSRQVLPRKAAQSPRLEPATGRGSEARLRRLHA